MKRRIQLRALICAACFLAFWNVAGSAAVFAQDPAQDPAPTQEPTQDPAQPQEPIQPITPDQSRPKPAGRENPVFTNTEEDPSQNPNALTPDTAALTGVIVPGIGSTEMRHSYFVPGFEYANFIRSSSSAAATVTDWNSTNYIAGTLSLLQQWSRSQLALNYSGGGALSSDPTQGNGQFHQLNLVQSFTFRRWQVAFLDQFSYLPQSQFGFGESSILSTPGINGPLGPALPLLQTNYVPNQTIFSSIGSRYSNSITGETAFQISPRGSFTLAGSYGILRFIEAGSIDTDDSVFSAGYDYAITKKDTIGVLYRYTSYNFIGNPQGIKDQTFEIAFGRKVTGRLAVQLFVGPEVTKYRLPLDGSDQRVSVAAGTNVTYSLPRTTLNASYNHGVSGGSGVFTGAGTDQLQLSLNRQLSRVWSGNVAFGYARNTDLGSLSSTVNTNLIFDSWFASVGLQRPIGRTATVSAGYTAYIETANQPLCTTGDCSSIIQHQINLSFQWHTRPFVLR
jgi:hypothetical protein